MPERDKPLPSHRYWIEKATCIDSIQELFDEIKEIKLLEVSLTPEGNYEMGIQLPGKIEW